MNAGMKLRKFWEGDKILVLPGVYDGLTAKICETEGFDGVVMGGYNVAGSRLAQPDVGYLSLEEMCNSLRMITGAIDIPVIADGDTGYGNAMSARRTVNEYERAGAAGILLEDQVWPKRCGHMAGKDVIDAETHAKKIRAAADGKLFSETVIVARTDARAVHGLDDAIARGHLYLESGADALFIEAPQSREELETIVASFPKGTILFANMIEGGRTPNLTSDDLQKMGFKAVFWPCTAMYTITKAFRDMMHELRTAGTTAAMQDRMLHFSEYNSFIGLDTYNEIDKKYK